MDPLRCQLRIKFNYYLPPRSHRLSLSLSPSFQFDNNIDIYQNTEPCSIYTYILDDPFPLSHLLFWVLINPLFIHSFTFQCNAYALFSNAVVKSILSLIYSNFYLICKWKQIFSQLKINIGDKKCLFSSSLIVNKLYLMSFILLNLSCNFKFHSISINFLTFLQFSSFWYILVFYSRSIYYFLFFR